MYRKYALHLYILLSLQTYFTYFHSISDQANHTIKSNIKTSDAWLVEYLQFVNDLTRDPSQPICDRFFLYFAAD